MDCLGALSFLVILVLTPAKALALGQQFQPQFQTQFQTQFQPLSGQAQVIDGDTIEIAGERTSQ